MKSFFITDLPSKRRGGSIPSHKVEESYNCRALESRQHCGMVMTSDDHAADTALPHELRALLAQAPPAAATACTQAWEELLSLHTRVVVAEARRMDLRGGWRRQRPPAAGSGGWRLRLVCASVAHGHVHAV